jgi:hypothetical protein
VAVASSALVGEVRITNQFKAAIGQNFQFLGLGFEVRAP